MNKLLYIAPVPIDFNNLDGVQKKILCQAKTLQKKFDVDILSYFNGQVFLYTVKTNDVKYFGSASSKLNVLKTAGVIVNNKEYQYSYIRYPRSDYYFIKMLKCFKKQNMSVIVEIPTYPYNMEGHETIRGEVISCLDNFFRKKIHKYVDRIVTFSSDAEIFDVPTIKTINGIDFESVEYDEKSIDIDSVICLIAVSAMFRVHGYERLIEGLNLYYSNGGKRNVLLKLVGKGDECAKYEALVKKYNLEKHVIFYGARFGQDLEELYEGNAMGINSLAIHRQGLKEESTLKTKEYAAKGLPVLSSSYVDAFSEAGNKRYVIRIPADESSVNIPELIEFVDELYKKNGIKSLREKIRNDGKCVCDINVTMKPIIDYYLGR